MAMNKIIIIGLSLALFASCKKELDVKNPNDPLPSSASNEAGIVVLAQGGVYVNGFKTLKYADGVFGEFWSGAMGFHEIMADVVGAEAANSYLNQIGCPNKVTLDDGTVILNPASPNEQISLVREINVNANQGSNPLYYEWAYMYNMISACNNVLTVVDGVGIPYDEVSKKAAIKTWAYWWKGFAYSRIGSTYYAGLINNISLLTNGDYKKKETIILESNKCLDSAVLAMGKVDNESAFKDILAKLIPAYFQVGKGSAPGVNMWKRSVNTLKARNILVNTLAKDMSAGQWQAILDLTNDGVLSDDMVFTGRSNQNGDFISGSGTVSGKSQGSSAGSSSYKLSERWVQEFDTLKDLRFLNNVKTTKTWIGNSDRGNVFNTKHILANGGKGLGNAKTVVFANTEVGKYELYLAGTFEENELMKAEASIYLGQVEQGLASIDMVRDAMGAGLDPITGTGLTASQAKEELRRERRITLAFRGLSFYDARRWEVIEKSKPRTGCFVIDKAGKVNTNATIEYGFLDYWDVPDNELAYNPASAGSDPVKNPKQ
jgi:starch-binding outer membrane protein, SusD/RagB family